MRHRCNPARDSPPLSRGSDPRTERAFGGSAELGDAMEMAPQGRRPPARRSVAHRLTVDGYNRHDDLARRRDECLARPIGLLDGEFPLLEADILVGDRVENDRAG